MNKEKIIGKIRKMFAIAEDDAVSNAEIQNAMGHAQRLMDAHHLTNEDLSHEPEDDYKRVNNAEFNDYRVYIGKKMFYWERLLARFVSKFVGVSFYRYDKIELARNSAGMVIQPQKKGKSFVFYGIAEDAAIAVDIYDELRNLISVMAVLRWGSFYKGDGAKYSEGFVSGLSTQLETARKLEKQTDSRAMILCSRRDDLVKYKNKKADIWLFSTRGIRLVKSQGSTGSKTGSNQAFAQGKSDGASTDVSRTKTRKLN